MLQSVEEEIMRMMMLEDRAGKGRPGAVMAGVRSPGPQSARHTQEKMGLLIDIVP